jgi:hypothetical protein
MGMGMMYIRSVLVAMLYRFMRMNMIMLPDKLWIMVMCMMLIIMPMCVFMDYRLMKMRMLMKLGSSQITSKQHNTKGQEEL